MVTIVDVDEEVVEGVKGGDSDEGVGLENGFGEDKDAASCSDEPVAVGVVVVAEGSVEDAAVFEGGRGGDAIVTDGEGESGATAAAGARSLGGVVDVDVVGGDDADKDVASDIEDPDTVEGEGKGRAEEDNIVAEELSLESMSVSTAAAAPTLTGGAAATSTSTSAAVVVVTTGAVSARDMNGRRKERGGEGPEDEEIEGGGLQVAVWWGRMDGRKEGSKTEVGKNG